MPNKPMTHDEARGKVCAVCTNQWGDKAKRKVTEKEENLIRLHVLTTYTSTNMFFPSGICMRCIHHLQMVEKGEHVVMKLSENYFCKMDRQTRSAPVSVCKCVVLPGKIVWTSLQAVADES